MLANQWNELLCRNQKRDSINKTEQPQDDEARQPIRISSGEKFLENSLTASHFEVLLSRARMNIQRPRVIAEVRRRRDVADDGGSRTVASTILGVCVRSLAMLG